MPKPTLSCCADCDNPVVIGYGHTYPDYETVWLCRWHFLQRIANDPQPTYTVRQP